MKLITKTIATTIAILFYTVIVAQIKNTKTETIQINGNCAMCKKTIEKAGTIKKMARVIWDMDSKMAILAYNSNTINQDVILKRIALAGYDNEKYLAPDDIYAKLPACCKYERKKLSATTKPIADNEMNMQDTTNKEPANSLSGIYAMYFSLKDALILNDGVTASNKAKELFKVIDQVPMDKMSSEQYVVWMKYMTKISYDVEHIKGVTETVHQRKHFSSLSKNMFEIMKVINPAYSVYFDHCPMYNDGKGGDWVSKEADIKNPFFGSQMLGCGKTVEIIK